MESKACLKLESISKKYSKKKKTTIALEGVNLCIHQGDFVGIIGKSGAGKTSLLNILGLISKPTDGGYWIYDDNVADLDEKTMAEYRNRLFGFILQEYGLIDTYTVIENVQLPLSYAKEKMSSAQKYEKTYEILKKLGMESRINDSCAELSGGQRQRVTIARALINNPDIILADEPTGALDNSTAEEFIELMHIINREDKKTIIMVTHDKNMLKYCNRIFEIKEGTVDNAPYLLV